LPVGYGNRFRHPDPSVLARYAKHGIEVDDTASAGALEIRLDAQGVERSRYRERARRYWFSGTDRAQP
jgi:competence protein ComEC